MADNEKMKLKKIVISFIVMLKETINGKDEIDDKKINRKKESTNGYNQNQF